ncbi:MAG: hypothetical protein ACI38Z_02825 [Parafannyhessea sp.]|uniref:hypothetical protein n=1 Tax=Parafannyhessea sp. TaxID=2847324 RepID=UPI003F0E5094
MDGREELVLRLAARRRAKLGLSDAAYAELLLAVREDPKKFLEDDADEAFLVVANAVDAVSTAREDDDLLDDGEFYQTREKRLARMRRECDRALALDPDCVDAMLLRALAEDLDPDPLLDRLLQVERDVTPADAAAPTGAVATDPDAATAGTDPAADAWTDVLARGRLRLKAAIARTCLDSARYRMANETGQELIALSPSDALGARHTCALALARLEDEPGFDALDAAFGRRGDSWVQIGRVILFYKLGRMGAARRALRGFDSLCDGGVYALLRPVMVDTYLPDRPATSPYTFDEATLAVHEADPIIVDVPDLVTWVQNQPDMLASAKSFADKSGLDW